MKKIYFLFSFVLFFSLQNVKAQCPTPTGMFGVPISLNGNCFINVQFAIPNSNVSIYNAGGYVAQGVASSNGNVVIPYSCSSNPITSLLSIITSPSVQICNTYFISQPIILPIKLKSFSGILTRNNTVMLTWATTLELNNEKYEVERSIDGVNYTKLTSINSNGSGLIDRTYKYEDILFTKGTTAFYRLRQVDYDGKSTFSNVIYISDKTASVDEVYSLFPNPVTTSSNNTVQIKGIAASDMSYSNIRIADMNGRNITYRITGANAIEINSSSAPGIYMIRIKDKTLKLIKQ